MKVSYADRFQESIADYLSSLPPESRARAIEDIRAIISEAVFGLGEDASVCPRCGGSDLVKNGHTAAGTQRYKCKGCGCVFASCGGRIFGLTKLPLNIWMKYAECFVSGVSTYKAAALLDVSQPTSWYMRCRVLQALRSHVPSFEVKDGMSCQLDGIYFDESFKGVSLKNYGGAMPRPPRHSSSAGAKRGISDDKVCVLTGVNDMGDFYYDVACRGAMTVGIAESLLESRICEGAIVNTDKHRAYARVMSDLKVAFHDAVSAADSDHLKRINDIHSAIRAFLNEFKGISTKWLQGYLAWFKWLRGYREADDRGIGVARSQFGSDDYDYVRRKLCDIPLPFRGRDLRPTKL